MIPQGSVKTQPDQKGTKKVLIAGIGYSYLKDGSFGPVLVKKLQSLGWPETIEIEDLSYGPIAAVHKLKEENYEKIILIGAMKRGRPPGTIQKYQWDGSLPDKEEIQACVEEAVSGVISLDNLLIICGFHKVFPPDVVVIEVEPESDTWGEGFTPKVQKAMEKVVEMVREEIGANTAF